MNLDPTSFTIHDIGAFPFVVFNASAAQAGYAVQWEKEMVALVENARPFVVVYEQLRAEESHEDRKHRGLWLKTHKEELGLFCRALISIEPDDARRTEVAVMSKGAVKAFGIPHESVSSRQDATDLASRLLV